MYKFSSATNFCKWLCFVKINSGWKFIHTHTLCMPSDHMSVQAYTIDLCHAWSSGILVYIVHIQYSLVQWNWFSNVTGCTWVTCIQCCQRTNFTAPGCRHMYEYLHLRVSSSGAQELRKYFFVKRVWVNLRKLYTCENLCFYRIRFWSNTDALSHLRTKLEKKSSILIWSWNNFFFLIEVIPMVTSRACSLNGMMAGQWDWHAFLVGGYVVHANISREGWEDVGFVIEPTHCAWLPFSTSLISIPLTVCPLACYSFVCSTLSLNIVPNGCCPCTHFLPCTLFLSPSPFNGVLTDSSYHPALSMVYWLVNCFLLIFFPFPCCMLSGYS